MQPETLLRLRSRVLPPLTPRDHGKEEVCMLPSRSIRISRSVDQTVHYLDLMLACRAENHDTQQGNPDADKQTGGACVGSFQRDQHPTKLSSFNAFRYHVTESDAVIT